MKQIRVVLQAEPPPPSLLAASRARSGYGLVGAAPRARDDDAEPSLDARILAIAAPSLLALALDPVLAAVDVAFVGRCGARSGAAPLAAVAASTGFFGFVFSATNSFTSAGTPLVAKARADDGDAAALRLGGAVVRAAAVVGVGLMLASEAAAPAAMAVFAPAGVVSASVAFTRLRAASAPAVVGAAALNGALRGVGDARAALDAAALAAVVNVSLDALLVWRLGLNPNGAAAATAVAEWAALAFLAARFARRVGDAGAAAAPDGVFAGLETFTHAAAATLARTLCLQAFLAATTAFVAARAGAAAAPTLLAAHLVLKQFYVILSFATDALAVAAQQLVASAPDAAAARRRSARLLVWGGASGLAFAALLYATPPSILTDDPAVAAAAAAELRRLVAPLQLLSSLVFVGDGILQGSRDFKFEAAAVAVAAAGGFAVLAAEGRAPDGALATAWDAVAALNALRFAAFVGRFYLRGPLVVDADKAEQPPARADVIDVAVTRMMEA